MAECKLLHTIDVSNTLGECILWNEHEQAVWWTDIHNATLYRFKPDTFDLKRYALPERLCSFGFTDSGEQLICAFANGLALYNPDSGDIDWLAQPEAGYRGLRFNDGRVDRHGRFWAGTMVEGDARNDRGEPVKGSLYCLSGNECKRVLSDLSIPNSLCWSLNGSILYFADSPTQVINAFDTNTATGEIDNKRTFAQSDGISTPDGSVIDADDCLWNAQWGGSKVCRYSTDGKKTCEIPLPVTQPTCVCFGGPDMNWLFVTTARENLDASQLSSQPTAGDVFIYETPFRGVAEPRFALDRLRGASSVTP